MSSQLVFIDDSGDPGFKGSASSSNFVMSAALFMEPKVATLVNNTIAEYRRHLGWRDDYEFKFSKIRKDIIIDLLQTVAKYDFQIYAVYVDKSNFQNVAQIIDNKKLYNWATKELLAIMPLSGAKIKIDGKYNKEYKLRIKSYMRRELNLDTYKIAQFSVQDSKRDNLIQLADLIAGSINRYLQPQKTDSRDYISIIKNKIVKLKPLDLTKE